jgi:hypothetical protein
VIDSVSASVAGLLPHEEGLTVAALWEEKRDEILHNDDISGCYTVRKLLAGTPCWPSFASSQYLDHSRTLLNSSDECIALMQCSIALPAAVLIPETCKERNELRHRTAILLA